MESVSLCGHNVSAIFTIALDLGYNFWSVQVLLGIYWQDEPSAYSAH